jgi:hypothetical protein
MAKKALTNAQEAIIKYGKVDTVEQTLFEFVSVLRGRIYSLTWFKNKQGVAETINIVFEDKTRVRITLFNKLDGTLRTSVKIL